MELHDLPIISKIKKQYNNQLKAIIKDSYNKGNYFVNNNQAIFTIPFDLASL